MKRMYTIRPGKIDDLQKTAKLLRHCNLPVRGLDEQFGETYCVAECDGHIIGVGGIELYGSYGLLRSVAVSPPWRGRSVGETIVKDRLAWARSNGLSEIFLLTTDTAEFFEHFGFHPVDRNAVPAEIKKSPEFSSICPESATVMVRSPCD